MTAEFWVNLLVAVLGIAVPIISLVLTATWRRQKTTDDKIEKLSSRVATTREEMLQHYVRHDTLKAILAELQEKIATQIHSSAAEIKATISTVMASHNQPDVKSRNDFIHDIIKAVRENKDA